MTPSPRDTALLFLSRGLRAFGAGSLGVLLALYLPLFGYDAVDIGLYLSLAVLAGAVMNFFFLRIADRFGRRRVLAVTGLLRLVSGLLLMAAQGPIWLVLAAICGAVPPGGNGLSSTIEQAMIGSYKAEKRAFVFGRYGLMGSAGSAIGMLAAALPALAALSGIATLPIAYRAMMALYALFGVGIVLVAAMLSDAVEMKPDREGPAPAAARTRLNFGLGSSHALMMRMAALYVADSFGSALVTTSLLVYWLHMQLGMGASTLGLLFFGTRVLAAISYPLAIWISRRVGLINTAVFTHIPSSLCLISLPFLPSVPLVAAAILLRGLLAEMDVPTRQSYISAVVRPEERAAAAGVTTLGQQVGSFAGPSIGGFALAAASAPVFVLAGGIKIAYDITLWFSFRHLRENAQGVIVRSTGD